MCEPGANETAFHDASDRRLQPTYSPVKERASEHRPATDPQRGQTRSRVSGSRISGLADPRFRTRRQTLEHLSLAPQRELSRSSAPRTTSRPRPYCACVGRARETRSPTQTQPHVLVADDFPTKAEDTSALPSPTKIATHPALADLRDTGRVPPPTFRDRAPKPEPGAGTREPYSSLPQ